MEYRDYKAKNQMELECNEQTNQQPNETNRAEPGLYGRIPKGGADIQLASPSITKPSISRNRRAETIEPRGNSGTEHLTPKSLIVSSRKFTEDFTPPDYLIDGLAQRRFIYSLTGNTGAGKTAIALRLAAHVALGLPLGDYDVEQGRVLYFAGENPDDLRMRWIALAEQMGFDVNTIDVHFIVGAETQIAKVKQQIAAEVAALNGVSLIIVDTSAAYFNCEECDDENNNVQAGRHARMFRSLTEVSDGPSVIVLTHPTKNAKSVSLLPRGGGAFIAEVDGNFTVQKQDAVSELHWLGKFRGPEFEPISFELHPVTAVKLKDSKGRPIRTVISVPLSEEDRAAIEASQNQDGNSLLALMSIRPGQSLMDMAKSLGWKNNKEQPDKRRVQKAIGRLSQSKLVAIDSETRRYTLTKKGAASPAAVLSGDVSSSA